MSVLSRIPLHPLLLAAFAVLSIYAENLAEVLPVDLGGPVARAVLAAIALLVVCSLVLRSWQRGAIVATAGVVAFGVFGRVSQGLIAVGLEERVQLAAWAVVVAVAIVFAVRARGSLITATLALNAFALVLVAMSLVTIVPFEAGRATGTTSADRSAASTVVTRHPDRDIYLIVFDRYGSDWSIAERFDITDNDLPEWLADQGFMVVPGARANYRATDFSLASMLSMDFLDDLTRTAGTDTGDRMPARALLVRPEVASFLKANGYRYYQLGSWYGPTQTNELADEVLAWETDTEFEAVLRQASALPAIDRIVGTRPEEDEFREGSRQRALYQFRQVQRLANVPGRKFVFAHVLLPHPPYVFDANGNAVLKATAETLPEEELYRGQLAFTNRNIRETVSALLAGPDEHDPIIIIAGDEGPFLCRNVDCIDGTPRTYGIRFGVLGAFHVPGMPADLFPPDHSSVNTFRSILSWYFGTNLPRLPDRSYDWPDNEHIYDFRDVTDELPLPGDKRRG